MLNQMIHARPDRVRSTGLAAMAGGALGVVCAPLYSLAYFATDAGAPSAESASVQAWAEPARDLLAPLLSFASPDTVYLTYGKLFLFVWIGMLAGLVGLHARHAGHAGRLERWGFRTSLVGLLLLTIGAFGAYWLGLVDASFAAFLVPGLLLVTFGATLFGLGTWRAGVAPRTGALLLIVGGFPGTFLISELATLGGGLVLLYLAWLVLGHSLRSQPAAPAYRAPSAPRAAPSPSRDVPWNTATGVVLIRRAATGARSARSRIKGFTPSAPHHQAANETDEPLAKEGPCGSGSASQRLSRPLQLWGRLPSPSHATMTDRRRIRRRRRSRSRSSRASSADA